MTTDRPRRPARYHEDQFRYAPNGKRVSELTDAELVAFDPSRAPTPPPLPDRPADEPDP